MWRKLKHLLPEYVRGMKENYNTELNDYYTHKLFYSQLHNHS
jgi:hypothetical protein